MTDNELAMLYPIGIQSFSEIREGGYVYVDKTAAVFSLASTGKYYFLSRPRRFGKSLLVSTMEAYFSGRKELFKGLAMETLEKDWTTHPVLHLDLTGSRYTSISDLEEKLGRHLSKWESVYGKTGDFSDPASRFEAVIEAAYLKTGNKVVILIDEYEKPIIDNMDTPDLMEKFRRELQGFYSVIKGKDEFIRFAFLTGVTKLGKMSILSGLNNLNDISMDAEFTDICGVSEDELKTCFDGSVAELAKACGMSNEGLRETQDDVRRISFQRTQCWSVQPVQSLEYIQSQEIPHVLVRDRHANVPRPLPQAGKIQSGQHSQKQGFDRDLDWHQLC